MRLFHGPARRMLLITLLIMGLRFPVNYLLNLLPLAEDPAVYYAKLILQEAVLWGLPALLMRPWRSSALPDNEKCLGGCVAAVFLGATVQLAMNPVTNWWAALIGTELKGMVVPENPAQMLLAVLALCLAPALCEEAFFRGSMLTGFTMSAQKWTALTMTTLLFALMHGSLAGLPAHLAVSLLFTLLMLRYGKLRVPILMHMGYNATAMAVIFLPLNLRTSAPLGMVLLGAALWIAGGVQWHSRRRLNLWDALLCLAALLSAGIVYLPELLRL